MVLAEFISSVDNHPNLEGVGRDDECVVVKHKLSGIKTKIPLSVIESVSWDDLEQIMTEKRSPHTLHHVSRIVGYFSTIENWNQSKKGELAYRHAGDYAVR
jgi:hypothetical protein